MPKYIITWNAGYGDEFEVVEVDSLEEAEEAAREEWKQDVENNASYEAVLYTEELAEELLQ